MTGKWLKKRGTKPTLLYVTGFEFRVPTNKQVLTTTKKSLDKNRSVNFN